MVSKVEDFRLTLLATEIALDTVAKDLGVILDPCLTYNDHMASKSYHHQAYNEELPDAKFKQDKELSILGQSNSGTHWILLLS